MNKRTLTFAISFLFVSVAAFFAVRHFDLHRRTVSPMKKSVLSASAHKMDARAVDKASLGFEENRGQTAPAVKFLAHGPDYAVYLSSSEAVFVHRYSHPLPEFNPIASSAENLLGYSRGKSAVRLQWLNSNPRAHVHGMDRQQGTSNYFIGNDPRKWRRKVPLYGRVQFDALYPGIDLVYHGDQKRVEFDYRLAPGADPHAIQLGVGTPSSVGITKEGQLSIIADGDEVVLLPPVAYQEFDGRRQLIPARYVLENNHRVAFDLGAYDHSRPLIIDPVLDFAASFGTGSNSTILSNVTVDPSGNAYVAGVTCDVNYPVTPGAFQQTGGSNTARECYDIVVSKFDPTGASILYSTYIGGTTEISGPGRAVVDAAGELYLVGTTAATDFPTTPGAYQTQAKGGTCDYGPFLLQRNCSDALLLKLSADGSSLVFSTLIGGERVELGTALAVDPTTQDIYVTGATNSTLFPIVGSAVQTSYGGGSCIARDSAPCFDAFVAKFSADGSTLIASTYFGGDDNDYGAGIALDPSGNVYVGGSSTSTNFPTTPGAFQTAHAGTATQPDAMVFKLNPALSTLQYSTLIGGGDYDLGLALQVDSTGSAYITGSTASSDFPTTAGSFQTAYAGPANADCPDEIDSSLLNQPTCGDAFVAKLNPAGSALTFSTLLGGSSQDIAFNLALDSSKNVWVFGQTNSTDFPYTPDAYYQATGGALFLAEISADGKTNLFSTPVGGNGLALGLAIDPTNDVFVAGQASIFSPTPGAYSTGNGGGVFLAKFSPGTARPGVLLSATSLSFLPPTYLTAVNSSSPPQTVTLTNNGTGTLHLAISVPASTPGTTPAPIAESDNCGSSVAPGAICTISVIYQPTVAGFNQSAEIQILSDAPNSPQIISVTGNSGIIESASFTPPVLNFPGQAPGTTSASQMSFLNGSATNANSFFVQPTAAPVVGGANPSDFQINLSNCTAGVSGCFVTVSFKPTGASPVNRIATITVATQAANSPEVLTLNGTVSTTPVISAFPIGLTPTIVGQTLNGTLTFTNTGGGTLTVTNLTVSGANASEFVFSNLNCGALPFNLASQATCSLNVAFKPTAPGNRTATLTFTDNEATPTSLALAGLGANSGGPEISLVTTPSPTNGVIYFPDTVVGHVTNFNIAIIGPLNRGSGASSSAHVTEALSGDFILAPAPATNCTLPTVLLAGGASCNYTVIFAPTATGQRTGTLTLTTDAPGTPSFSVNFSGNGVTIPAPTLTPAVLNFGQIVPAATSAAQTLTLTNSGNGPLTFAAPVLTGPFALSANTCTSPLAATASCTFSIKFSPPAKGPASGTLTLTTNAASQILAAGFLGSGVTGPVPSASPSNLTFGNQPVNSTSPPQPVILTNTGDTTFNIAGVHATENFSQTNNCGASLAPAATCTINVSFAPGNDTYPMFQTNGQVFITTNAPGSPLAIPLIGTPTASSGAATVILIATSPSPSTVGQSVTFTATVTSQTAGTITGTVTFYDNATQVGTGALTNGTATFTTTSLAAGTHSITASYPGDSNFAPSHSSGAVQVVNGTSAAASTTTLTSTPNPSTVGQSVAFTATVTSQTTGTIAGTVNFLDGATQIGTGTIASGIATFATTTLVAGTHSVTAQYTGNTTFAASTSTAVSQVVNAAVTGDFSIAVAPSTVTVAAGQTGTSTITVAPLQGFASTVTLACGALPAKVTCAISPASVTLDGTNSKTAAVMIGTVANTALTPTTFSPKPPRYPFGLFLSALLALLLLFLARRSSNPLPQRVLLAAAMLVLAFGLGSCNGGGGGSSGSTGTTPGTYPITLTGVGPSGSPAHSTTLTVTVTK
jgi:hypothetical protein